MSSRPIAAVLFRDETRAQALAQLLESEGLDPKVACNTDQFYDLVNRERADLVMVEHRLRGFLTGLEILERLYDDLLRPPTMLIADLNPDEDRRARRLGIDSVIDVNMPLEELASAARSVVAHSRNLFLPVPLAARQLVQDSDCIRPLPQLLVRMCSYLNQESPSLDSLARDIAVDPKATAELLKLANSSAMGRAYRTPDVYSAVKYLGVRKTISLIISAGMLRAQSGLLADLPEEVRSWYNGRSVLIASTAAAFASSVEGISPETAYILGLLQDLGCLLLAYAYPDRYVRHLQRVRQIGHLRLECVEQDDFGFMHADVSAALLMKWELPLSLTTMVLDHHNPERVAERSALHQAFVRVMQVGEAVADLADNRSTHRYLLLHQQLLTYNREQLSLCHAALKDGVSRMLESSRIFRVPIPNEEMLMQLTSKMSRFAGSPLEAAARAEQARLQAKMTPEQAAVAPTSYNVPIPDIPRLLVIDDEAGMVELIRIHLAAYGVEVCSAATSEQARRLAGTCQAIVCDVHLGRESGAQVVRLLRADGFTGPVIMMSADRSRATVEACISAGIDDYLIKPFSMDTLRAKLEKHGLSARKADDPVDPQDEAELVGSAP